MQNFVNYVVKHKNKNKKKRPQRPFFFSVLLPLRSHAVDVTREHRAFLDVGDAEEAGGDTLQADGEAAVRGHAVCPRAPLRLCARAATLRARSAHTVRPQPSL